MKAAWLVVSTILVFFVGCDNRALPAGGALSTPDPDGAPAADVGMSSGEASLAADGPGAATKPPPGTLQAVVSQVIAPITSSMLQSYSLDLNGDGKKDNEFFYSFQSVLTIVPPPTPTFLQEFFDKQLAGGTNLTLLELTAKGLVTDAKARLTNYSGLDLDGDPTNNFSGGQKLGVKAKNPIPLPAAIKSGQLMAGPGSWTYFMPLGQTSPTPLTLKMARVTTSVTKDGFKNTVIAGAFPASELDSKLTPAVAQFIDHVFKDPKTAAATKKLLGDLLDLDNDGTINAKEIAPFVKTMIQPDLDTDSDGVLDGISIGFGVQTVSCVIQK